MWKQNQAHNALSALSTNLKRLDRQHSDCRPGINGTKHTNTAGACCVGTMRQPDEPTDIVKLQFDRMADLEAKIDRLRREAEQQTIANAERKNTIKALRQDWTQK